MMKIGFVSDIHLGYATGRITVDGVNLRELDGYMVFRNIIDQMIQESVDAVVIGGDLYHSPHPNDRARLEMQDGLRKLANAGIKVYALSGNHDVSDRKYDIAATRLLRDEDRHIYAHVEPYAVHEISDNVYVHLISHHMYRNQEKTMLNVKPVPGAINILSTHGSIVDPIMELVLTTEKAPREIVIPDFILAMNWDYIMLGHIHERQFIGDENGLKDNGMHMLYNGSTIRRGFSDGETPLGRGWVKFTIEHNGTFTPEFMNIEQRPQYDFETIDATHLSAPDITDLIKSRLRDVQGANNETAGVDIEKAPILRQKIINITPSKQAGMDIKGISVEAQHALTWDLKMETLNTNTSSVHKKVDGNKNTGCNHHLFKDWATEKSETIANLHPALREQVTDLANDYITKGQDIILEQDT